MSQNGQNPTDPPPRPRILLVEDNQASREGLARLLEAHGYAVSTVHDGRSAVEALRAGPRFDLLLTDLRLPDLDGREVARLAREMPNPSRTALITGWDPEPNQEQYARWGIDWVFTKPINFLDLMATLREALGKMPRPQSSDGEDDSTPEAP